MRMINFIIYPTPKKSNRFSTRKQNKKADDEEIAAAFGNICRVVLLRGNFKQKWEWKQDK